MNIRLLEEDYSFENSKQGLEQLINMINEKLTEKDVFFSHMIIDGEEVYDEPTEYILSNIENIKNIDVKTKTINEFVADLIVSLNDYTGRAIPEIQNLVDQFYQKPSSESWSMLEQLLEGIEWIYQTIKNIDKTSKSQYRWDEYIKVAATFEAELPNLMDALENKDAVLVADIVQYEILPQFEIIRDTTVETFNGNHNL